MSHDMLNSTPNMKALTAFPTRHGKVNIPQEIGVDYRVFGAQLLDDPTGAKVNNMQHKHGRDSLQINTEILQEWLRGQGRRPVSWRTLVEVLKDIKLGTLAGDIEESCSADVIIVMDTEPSFSPSKIHQQTTLTSWRNVSIAILYATISLLLLLAIGYWPEKLLNGYVKVLKFSYQKQPVSRYWLEKHLNGYTNVLKATYQKQPVTDPDHWLHVVMPFINLTLTEGDIPPVQGHLKYQMHDKYKLSLDEVVSSVKEGSKILIEGRPGVGKTTLLRQIAKQWAEQRYLQNFPLVVLVLLGHIPSSRITNLESMLEYHSHGYPDTVSATRELGLTGGKGICFLLDALDEYLPQEGDFIYQLIKGQTLPDAAMIVTSRPNHLRQHFTRKFEVVGFLEHQIQQYISALPLNNVANISEYLHHHTNVKRISYLPLHLAMLTYLAVHSEQVTLLDLDTDTKIYHMFVNLTFRQRYKDVENLDEIHNQAFSALSRIAFNATTRSNDYGASLRLHHLDPELKAKLESFSIISINKQHEGDRDQYTFTFSHNTFQEFFAAYYLTTLPHEEQIAALELYQYSPSLMWRFFFGLLRDHTSENTTKLFEKFAHIQISTAWLAECRIMMCAYELKQTVVGEVLVRVLNYSITFEFIDPLECAASAYVISLNPHQFRRLEIGFGYVTEDYQEACFNSMLAELPKNNEVAHVTLDELSLSDGTVSAMVKLLQYFPYLQKLELFNLYTTPGVSLTVAKELEELGHVRHVGIGIQGYFSLMVNDYTNATILTEVLTHLPHLEHLSLGGVVVDIRVFNDPSHKFIRADGAVALARGVGNKLDRQLQALGYNNIGGDGAVAIAEILKHAASLQTLKLKGKPLGDEGVAALAEGIKHLTSLQALELEYNHIGNNSLRVAALAEGIEHLTSLQTLNLRLNLIRDDGAAALAEGIKNLTSLQILDLYGNIIGDDGAAALAEGIKHLTSLQTLNLCGNRIGDDGVTALAESIKHLTSLQVLELEFNDIGENGVAALAEGIEHLTSLQTLNLGINRIGDDGVAALAEGIKHLTSLQTLTLTNNRIGDDGVVALTRGLKNLTSLKKLFLNNNGMGDMGAARLTEETKHLNSLKELSLWHNKISDEEKAKLRKTGVRI